MTTQTKWVMPEWMEKYIPMIGYDKIEIIAAMGVAYNSYNGVVHAIRAKVELLQQLHDKKLI